MCVTIGIQETAGEITDAQRAEGFGSASLILKDSTHLIIIPDTKFAYPDGTIELQGNAKVNANLAHELGFSSIEVLQGIYKVDFSSSTNGTVSPYGSVTVNLVTQ